MIYSTLDQGSDFMITSDHEKKFHFKILTFPVPSGLISEGIEVMAATNQASYIFSILSDFNADIEEAELRLKAKIKRGINKVHLEQIDGRMTISDNQELRGRIELGATTHMSEKLFIIDGKRISTADFLNLLEEYDGWNFLFHGLSKISVEISKWIFSIYTSLSSVT